MKESAFWLKVRPHLSGLDPIRVENACAAGTPDVECALGWIELKVIPKLPDSDGDILRVPHFLPSQRAWLAARSVRHGNCWLLLCAGPWWMLFDGGWAAKNLGKVSSAQCQDSAIDAWFGSPLPGANSLVETLKGSWRRPACL